MADTRIKDLPETLDVGAEDYVAVDNAGDGTRKFTLRQLVASVGAPEFVVNVNASGEADKTLSEINTAISNGYVPVVLYDGGYYQLAETTETAATFTKRAGPNEMAEISITSGAVRIETNTLTSDDIGNSSGVIGENVSYALDNLAYNITNFSESVSDIRDDISVLNTRVTTLENEGGGGGSGLTDDIKTALLQIAQKVAYIDVHGPDYYDDLYNALYNDTTRSVLLVLSHVSSSNTQSTVEVGDSYTTTLTASTNYTLNSVSVTMGGVDITSTSYSSGTVSIPSVTGNIVITATAVLAAQSISVTYTQSGTVYDTDTLDSLKADLVVTANYSGGTSETVPASDYTLSGTLAAGTSTITVTYAGLTDTFSVTVTEYLDYYPYEIEGTGVVNASGGIQTNGNYYYTSFFDLDANYSALTLQFDSTNETVYAYVQFFNDDTFVTRLTNTKSTESTKQYNYSSIGDVTKARMSWSPKTLTNVKIMKGLV